MNYVKSIARKLITVGCHSSIIGCPKFAYFFRMEHAMEIGFGEWLVGWWAGVHRLTCTWFIHTTYTEMPPKCASSVPPKTTMQMWKTQIQIFLWARRKPIHCCAVLVFMSFLLQSNTLTVFEVCGRTKKSI